MRKRTFCALEVDHLKMNRINNVRKTVLDYGISTSTVDMDNICAAQRDFQLCTVCWQEILARLGFPAPKQKGKLPTNGIRKSWVGRSLHIANSFRKKYRPNSPDGYCSCCCWRLRNFFILFSFLFCCVRITASQRERKIERYVLAEPEAGFNLAKWTFSIIVAECSTKCWYMKNKQNVNE